MTNSLEIDYNTSRPKMIIPEYGRNVQNMIDHCKALEDREERNKCAQAIIKVMGQLKPTLRDQEEYTHKLWAHMFIMADFQLDVDSPYPIPSPETFTSKPDKVDYPQTKIRFGHYGKIMEKMIEAAVNYEEGDAKNYLVKRIGNLLKTSYLLWNRDTVNDAVIVKHLSDLSGGKLKIEESDLIDTAEILRNFKTTSHKKGSHGKKQNRKHSGGRGKGRRR